MKSILFIGGLHSTGNKARFIENYILEKKDEVTVDVITPDYIEEYSMNIISDISILLRNDYNFIIASSTGALFLLTALINNEIKSSRIIFINPLLSINENLLYNKESTFLDKVNPMLEGLQINQLKKTSHKFTFFLSEKDEVIGSQVEAIEKLKFPSSKRIFMIDDNHRFSSSMGVVAKYILRKINFLEYMSENRSKNSKI